MGYRTNGCDTGGFPFYLFKSLIEKYDVPYWVETGTASGDSARIASELFNYVWTIELIENEENKSAEGLEYLTGDSVKLLPEIISYIKSTRKEKQYAIVYLDAHYCGDEENNTGYPECPVLQEIEIVAENGYETIIVIDDARLFLGQPPHPHNPKEWPSVLEIFTLLKEKFPYHHITITDDYILAIPLHVRDVIDEEWRERFHIRYPNDKEKLRTEMKNVYNHAKKKFGDFLKYIE
jgi:hypothetical protein